MSKRIKQRAIIDGKEIWLTGATQQEIFDAYRRRMLEAYGADHREKPCPQTPFMEYARKWFNLYHTAKVKKGTARNTASILDKHFEPYFTGEFIEEITTDAIQLFFNLKHEYSQSMCQKFFIYLHEIFDCAVDDGLISRNPVNAKRISYSKKKTVRQPITRKQASDVLQQIEILKGIDKLEIAIPLLTGIRRGEFLGLRWEDVDFEKDMLRIERAIRFSDTGNQPVIGPTKSPAGVRCIPILPELKVLLTRYRKESGYLFECAVSKPTYADDYKGHRFDDIGHPKTQRSYTNDMKRILKQIQLYGAKAHALRHTFATIAAGEMIDVKTLQGLMGHSDVTTTLKIYTHIQNEKMCSAGIQLAGMYSSEDAPRLT